MFKIRYPFLIVIIILVIAVLKLSYDLNAKASQNSTSADSNVSAKKYPYLASRIMTNFEKDLLINFIPLRKELKTVTKDYGQSFSVYFEYLPTGISIGINDRTEFYGASLIKVPLAMAFLNSYHKRGLSLEEKVVIRKEEINKGFGDLWKKGEGAEIKLIDALKLALTESDNTAAEILVSRVPKEDYDDVYQNLDIEINEDDGQVILTTKGYSSILKALYFASALNKDDSEYILDLLTQNKFRNKLLAPIPEEIPVAHKDGVYFGNLYQDCGIVYVPRRPYILCMASQSKENEAVQRMKEISEIVYKYISSISQ